MIPKINTLIIASTIMCLSLPVQAKSTDKAESWVSVNEVFHKIYAKKRENIKNSLNPLVMIKGNDLILIKDGKRESYNTINDKYDFLKTVSHVPLAVYVCLHDKTSESIEKSTIEELTQLKGKVLKARKNVDKWNLSTEEKNRQYKLIDDSINFIDKVLDTKYVTEVALRKFTRGLAPATLENGYDAVQIELGCMDKHLRAFRKGLSKEEWDNLYVVIISSHMPRNQERHTQYFLKLLQEKKLGNRVIYCESAHSQPITEKTALDLVATHILDRQVAINFYKDPFRMHRDLLSDAAKKYLKKNKLKWSRK